jgi:outer membrane protein assembly factor BamB
MIVAPAVCALTIGMIFLASARGAADDAADRETSRGVLPTASHQVQREYSLACQAIQQQRFGEAAAMLQTLLGGDVDDLFLATDEGTATQTTVRRETLRLIDSLPPEGRESYQLQFGSQAQAMLQRAAAAGDRQGLVRVSESWFHTPAGYEATLLLARDALDQGRPLAAVSWLRRIRQSPAALRACQPELGLLAAACWLLAGDADQARESLVELGRACPGVRYRIGDREFSAAGDTAEALKLLSRSIRPQGSASPAAAADWPVFRGSPARNRSGDWNGSLGKRRWQVTTFDEKNASQPFRMRQPGGSREAGASPSVQPLLVGNLVLLRTPQRLLAVDEKSGRTVWEYPWQQAAEKPLPGPFGMDANMKIQQRLEDDVLWGQLSSDGQRVFLLDDLPFALDGPHGRAILAGAVFNPGGVRGLSPPTCRLVALDLRREGQLCWAVGGADGEDEPKLAGAMFLGSPVPDGPQLYVLAEIQGDVLLCQLEASSGRLAWSQVVARPRENVHFEPLRRLAGAAPSLAEGLIVCPTSAGAVVAVDAATHSLVWGFAYHLSPAQASPVGRRVNVILPSTSEAPRWVDAAVIISGRRVLAAPVDSDQLYCLDLLTGEEIWSCDRSGMLYLGCVHAGQAVLVGPHEVTALRLADRKPAWSPASIPIPSNALSRGRGLCAGHYFYLPTSSKQLPAIDLDAGRLAATINTDGVLGSLVGVRNCLISQSPTVLEAFDVAEKGSVAQ